MTTAPPGIPMDQWVAMPGCAPSMRDLNPTFLQKASTLYYSAAAGQTIFQLSTPDHFGNSYTIDAATVLAVTANGSRLTLDDGAGFGAFTVNVPSNAVILTTPATAGEQIIVDIFYEQTEIVTTTTNSVTTERVNITAPNVFAPLQQTPDGGAMTLTVNGAHTFSLLDIPPSFVVNGNQIQWASAIYSVQPTDSVIVNYTYGGGGGSGSGGSQIMGGDVSGLTSTATVIGLQGRPVSDAAPSTGQGLAWDGTQWAPGAVSGGGGGGETQSLVYVASAGQTVFNLSNPDKYGQTYTLASASLGVYSNGARLALDDGTNFGGYTVNVPSNQVHLIWPAGAGQIIMFEVPIAATPEAARQSLVYVASAGQTVFNLSAPDRYGQTGTLDPTSAVYASGARLAEDDGTNFGGYTVNIPANRITLLWPAGAGEVVIVDI